MKFKVCTFQKFLTPLNFLRGVLLQPVPFDGFAEGMLQGSQFSVDPVSPDRLLPPGLHLFPLLFPLLNLPRSDLGDFLSPNSLSRTRRQ